MVVLAGGQMWPQNKTQQIRMFNSKMVPDAGKNSDGLSSTVTKWTQWRPEEAHGPPSKCLYKLGCRSDPFMICCTDSGAGRPKPGARRPWQNKRPVPEGPLKTKIRSHKARARCQKAQANEKQSHEKVRVSQWPLCDMLHGQKSPRTKKNGAKGRIR